MASPTKADQLRLLQTAFNACLANAEEMLVAARQFETQRLSPRIQFHLAALALEEIGKGDLLRIAISCLRTDREVPSMFHNSIDDHVKKLFWATWAPAMFGRNLTKEQFEQNRNLATNIHETRLRGLYVDVSDNQLSLPTKVVPQEQASNLIGMASARLGMVEASDFSDVPEDRLELIRWFVEVSDDSQWRPLIFGSKSLDKLSELRDTGRWVEWLKHTIDEDYRRWSDHLRSELGRERSDPDSAKPKYELTLRFYTFTNSIRPTPLESFGKGMWITLHPVQNHKDQLLAKITLLDTVRLEELYKAGLQAGNLLLAALNIASAGYFYWYLPVQVDRYYEKSVDLQSDSDILVTRQTPLRPDLGRNRRVLDQAVLDRARLNLAVIFSFEGDEGRFLGAYLEGLAWIAKSDLHFDLSNMAFKAFFEAFVLAVELFEDNSLPPEKHIERHLREFNFTEEDLQKYLADGNAALTNKLGKVPMEQALNMKVLLDSWLWPWFQGRLKQLLAKE